MAQEYDKIFKENIEELILPLAGKLLNIHPEKIEEIPDDLQATIERRPDFLKKVLHTESRKDYILHIEFQTVDDLDMVYRMSEYYALLLRKFKIEVKQYVFFMGKKKSKMIKELSFSGFSFSYEIINLIEFDYHQFLESNKPEEIILSILSNFGIESPEKVVSNILSKLDSLKISKLNKEKSFIQLEILSKLRNLQRKIIEKLEDMSFTYDLESDIRFKQGLNQGVSQGISQGIDLGKEKKAIAAIKNMLAANIPITQIAQFLDETYDFVKKIEDSLKK